MMTDKHRFVTALQYLYYVRGDSPWTNKEYDAYCKHHQIHIGNQSERPGDYSKLIISLAASILANPRDYQWRKVDPVDFVATSDGWLPVNVAPDRKMP